MGLIAVIINRKNKKAISLVALIISIIAFIVVLATQSFYSNSLDKVSKKIDTSISSSQKKAEAKFKWTKTDYDTLTTGDSMTGVGGTNYNTLESKFGKPSNSSESSSGDYTSKNVTWDNMGASNYKSVDLTFVKQSDGSWLLSDKMQSGLD